jgi:hypothetical protein
MASTSRLRSRHTLWARKATGSERLVYREWGRLETPIQASGGKELFRTLVTWKVIVDKNVPARPSLQALVTPRVLSYYLISDRKCIEIV